MNNRKGLKMNHFLEGSCDRVDTITTLRLCCGRFLLSLAIKFKGKSVSQNHALNKASHCEGIFNRT